MGFGQDYLYPNLPFTLLKPLSSNLESKSFSNFSSLRMRENFFYHSSPCFPVEGPLSIVVFFTVIQCESGGRFVPSVTTEYIKLLAQPRHRESLSTPSWKDILWRWNCVGERFYLHKRFTESLVSYMNYQQVCLSFEPELLKLYTYLCSANLVFLTYWVKLIEKSNYTFLSSI